MGISKMSVAPAATLDDAVLAIADQIADALTPPSVHAPGRTPPP